MMMAGAVFAIAVAWALGRLLLVRQHAPAFVAGSVALAAGVAVCGPWGKAALGAMGAAALAAAWWRCGPAREKLPPLPCAWAMALAVVGAGFGGLYLLHAMMPEVTLDGRYHHLAAVAGGEPLWSPVALVYRFAFVFGGYSAAALVNLAYLAALAMMLADFGRRMDAPKAGVAAAVLVFASPLAGVSGATASEDAAVAALLFAGFCLLHARRFVPAAMSLAGAGLTMLQWSGPAPGGMPGPVFLLAPLGLVALRWSAGRQAVAAALALVWAGWMPAMPFLALAMGLAVNNSRYVTPLLVAGHALLSWPDVVGLYTSPDTWRIRRVSLRAALRLREQELPPAARLAQNTPPDARIYSLVPLAASQMKRGMLTVPGMDEVLRTPVTPEWQPLHRVRLRWSAAEVSALRVWTPAAVNELRIFDGDAEAPRAREWRLSGRPDCAAVQNAFDNSPVTRWTGEMLEVRFGALRSVSGMVLECPRAAAWRVEAQAGKGWRAVSASVEERSAPPPPMRRAAIFELKRRGAGYLLVDDGDPAAQDLLVYAHTWGVRETARSGRAHLLRLE
ncbi:MAG: hypothetical protein M1541_13920 [Acidobacteria bacterium]|nr:hypothetical protein [Acidobacteriota bacterium]